MDVDQTAVVGMKNREINQINASAVKKTDAVTLQGSVATNADETAKAYTDGTTAYDKSPFDHNAVNHSSSEYVDCIAQTNGIKSFWVLLKRGYRGIHRHISSKHLHRCVGEFSIRHSIGKMNALKAMAVIAKGIIDKQIQFEDWVK